MTTPKPSASHLHLLNIIVATVAGVISIVGGIYSLKSSVFVDKSPGEVQGVVLDQKIAKPLWLVPIEVSLPDGSVVDTANTDQEGHYSLKSLKPGAYIVKATAPLHVSQTKNVTIENKRVSTINFDLAPIKIESETLREAAPPNVSYPPAANSYPQLTQYQEQNTLPANSYASPPAQAGTTAVTWRQAPHMPRRNMRPVSDSQTTTSGSEESQPSLGSALTQTGTQLLQEWLQQKTSNKT